MNDNFYKQLMEESLTGYAYYKIICDEGGTPCDYECIEVNATFEELTGLKGSAIVGKKITEIFPNSRESDFDRIQYYGDIAINGGKKEFQQFSVTLKRWYKMKVYSPEKYYFIIHFMDITKEMSQLSELEKMVHLSEEFLQINEQEINYQKIADDFLTICGAKYAAFNLFDEDGKNYTTMALAGDKGILKKASRMLGFKLEKKRWKYDPIMIGRIKHETITFFNSLRVLVGNVI